MNADLTLIALFAAMEKDHTPTNQKINYIGRTLRAFHRRTGIFLQDPEGHPETKICIARW